MKRNRRILFPLFIFLITVCIVVLANYHKLKDYFVTEHLITQITKENVDVESYIDNYINIHVGENDKKFVTELIKNHVEIECYKRKNSPDMLCEYRICIGDLELGFDGAVSYANDSYYYIFLLDDIDIAKFREWTKSIKIA